MKILFYTNNINPTFGGSVFSLQLLVKELIDLGVDVKVIVNRHHEKEVELGVPVIALNAKFGDLQRPFLLKKIVAKETPDVIFATMRPMMISLGIAHLFSPGSNTKFAGIERMADHGLLYLGKLKYIPKRFFVKLTYGLLDHIVAISEFVKRDLHETYWLPFDKLSVVYNAVDLESIREKAKKALPKEDEALFKNKKVMLNIGRLTEQKAQYHLINILSLLKDKCPNLDLVILGEGKLKESLLKQAKQCGVEGRVHLLGQRDNPFPYIGNAKLFALTSVHEAFGRVVLESMAIATPVVAFDARGGHVELLADGAGTIVSKENEKEFSEAVLKVLEDNEKRTKIVEAAYNKSNSFSARAHAEAYINCVRKLVKNET